MGITVADGTFLAIASTYATSSTMTALTNATEAVATLGAGHAVVVGDVLELTSGWPEADGRLVRVKTVATNDVTLELFDTSNTTRFPAAGGTGSVRRITAWTTIAQILELSTEGGDQQFYTYQFLNELVKRRVPTAREPYALKMKLADDITLAQDAIIKAAESSGVPKGVRFSYRNGAKSYVSGFWTRGAFAELTLGEANKRALDVALTGLPSEYAS